MRSSDCGGVLRIQAGSPTTMNVPVCCSAEVGSVHMYSHLLMQGKCHLPLLFAT